MTFPSSSQKIRSFPMVFPETSPRVALIAISPLGWPDANSWRFPDWYLVWHTGQLRSPPGWSTDSLIFSVMQAWQKLWPQSKLRGSSGAPERCGRSPPSVSPPVLTNPTLLWPLLPRRLRLWLTNSQRAGNCCWRGQDKKGRKRKAQLCRDSEQGKTLLFSKERKRKRQEQVSDKMKRAIIISKTLPLVYITWPISHHQSSDWLVSLIRYDKLRPFLLRILCYLSYFSSPPKPTKHQTLCSPWAFALALPSAWNDSIPDICITHFFKTVLLSYIYIKCIYFNRYSWGERTIFRILFIVLFTTAQILTKTESRLQELDWYPMLWGLRMERSRPDGWFWGALHL